MIGFEPTLSKINIKNSNVGRPKKIQTVYMQIKFMIQKRLENEPVSKVGFDIIIG